MVHTSEIYYALDPLMAQVFSYVFHMLKTVFSWNELLLEQVEFEHKHNQRNKTF